METENPILMDENTLNPTMNDICICPDSKCGNDTFYHTDYGRVFCSKCRREVRENKNFKGGRLLTTTPHPSAQKEKM
jgi:hypothetical protein